MQHEKETNNLIEVNITQPIQQQIFHMNTIISHNIIPIINKLNNRINELHQKKQNLLNSLKNNNEIISKQTEINKTKRLLNLIQTHLNENQEYSSIEINDIIETYNHSYSILNYDLNNKISYEKKNLEIEIKHIIADCLLDMKENEYHSKNSQKSSRFNTYVNNTLSRRGSKQIKKEPSIKILKKRDNTLNNCSENNNNNNNDCTYSRPYTNISSNPVIGHSDTLASFVNKKSESDLTENSNNKQSTENIKSKPSTQTINTTKNNHNSKRIVYRNANINNISHMKAFSLEYNKIKRSMSSLSNQSSIGKTSETIISKKQSLQHAQLFVSVTSINKNQKKSVNKKISKSKGKIMAYSNKNEKFGNIRNEENSYKSYENKKRLRLKINNSVRQTKKNLLKNKSSDNSITNNNQREKSNENNKRRRSSLPKQNSMNVYNYNRKVRGMNSSPSMLNDYTAKKEKIQKKLKLSRLLQVLRKIFKKRQKELCIQCFYDLILLNRPKLQTNVKKQRKKISNNKITLKILLRKFVIKNISMLLKLIVLNYNNNIKKKNKKKSTKKKHSRTKSYQINKTISNKSSKKVISNNSKEKINLHIHPKSKMYSNSHIERNNNSFEKKVKYTPKEIQKSEDIMNPIYHLQDDVENNEILIQEPIIIYNNDTEINNNNNQSIETINCIQTYDQIMLLEDPQNQYFKNEHTENEEHTQKSLYKIEDDVPPLMQQSQIKDTHSSITGSIKLDEEAINIPDPLKHNDSKSVPITPFNRQNNSDVDIDTDPQGMFKEDKIKIAFDEVNIDDNYETNNEMYIEDESFENEEEDDFSHYYEGLKKLKQLNAETKEIEMNMKLFLQGV